jgi:hypothetical protein
MARKLARILCIAVVFGVILLCQIHAVIQIFTGGLLDFGDWIGIGSIAFILLIILHRGLRTILM